LGEGLRGKFQVDFGQEADLGFDRRFVEGGGGEIMAYRIKNWEKFQHYKTRRPPWIKLYRKILDDKDWYELKGESAKLLVMLWLLASENNGIIPSNEHVAFRFRLPLPFLNKTISTLSNWLEHDASTTLATHKQDDLLETEKETETDGNNKMKKHAFNKPTPEEVTAYAKSLGYDLNGQYFFDHYEMGGWVYGKSRTPIKDWKCAVRKWKANARNAFGNNGNEEKKEFVL